MRVFLFLVLFLNLAFGAVAESVVRFDGRITSAKVLENGVLVGLDNGKVVFKELTNVSENATKTLIQLPPKREKFAFFGESAGAKVFSVDSAFGVVAFFYETDNDNYKIGVIKNGKFKSFVLNEEDVEKASVIAQSEGLRAKFGSARLLRELFVADEKTLVGVTLGSEILFVDIESGRILQTHKLSIYGWQDATLDRKSETLVVANESGVAHFFDLKNRKFKFSRSLHKDLIYQIDLRGRALLSGSADRSVLFENGELRRQIKAGFAVKAVALGERWAAFSAENAVVVLGLDGEVAHRLDYAGRSLEFLGWLDEATLVGAGFDDKLYVWRFEK